MQHFEPIKLRKERDFGDIVNVTFQFLRQNLIPLGKSLLFVVGPAALLLGFVSVGGMSMVVSPTDLENFETINMAALGLYYMLMMFFSVVTLVLALTVVNGYIVLYQEKGGRLVPFEEVWRFVLDEFWGMLTVVALVFVIFVGVYFVVIIPSIFITAASVASGSGTLSIITGLIVGIGVICLFIYLGVTYTLAFSTKTAERVGALAAIKRSHFLIRSNWWSTFFILAITYILAAILGLLFTMPGMVISFTGMMLTLEGDGRPWFWWPLMMLSIVGTLGSSLLYAIPFVASMLQYYNLVEQKEGRGLMDRIDELGSASSGETTGYE